MRLVMTGRHEDERGTKDADLLGIDPLWWWYPIDRPQGRHERRSRPLALYIEARNRNMNILSDPIAAYVEARKQDVYADAAMAEFLGLKGTAKLPYQRFEQIKRFES